MCRRFSEAAKTHLGVDIAGSSLFDATGHLRPPAPSAPKRKTVLAKTEASLQIQLIHQSHQTICHPSPLEDRRGFCNDRDRRGGASK